MCRPGAPNGVLIINMLCHLKKQKDGLLIVIWGRQAVKKTTEYLLANDGNHASNYMFRPI